MEKILSGIKIECQQGDIAAQKDIEAVVNAANAQLKTGGGVAGAIHRAAGPGLYDECRSLAPINPGEAVITRAHELPNDYVIHCLGPVYGRDQPEDKLLADCYRNALEISEENKIDSVAFPALSTGAFGYPTKDAAKIAFETISEMLPKLQSVKKIRFVLYDKEDLDIHESIVSNL
ncbi:macro domain-containing protein [Psychroflexus sp. CAK57W]|uniref:macro domain-containing protein n=1 Tax=Psychroflexus curvus TaxID=2873595 RepID=UPI001CCD288D|nr:macro domain-containing protein [Psychroflexus curvus]MBZ9787624.1 macro domain-containing protein [Psychroflexus curvus]